MTLKETAKYLRIADDPLDTRLRNLSTLTAALTAQYFVAKNKAAVFFQLILFTGNYRLYVFFHYRPIK
jgi:hypothetical protein